MTKNKAKVVAKPLSTEQADHTSTTRATVAVRRPLSASRPAGSRSTTPAKAAAVGMAPATVSLNPKWSWMAGNAPATRLTSTRSTKATRATTTAAHHPNGAERSRSTLTAGRPVKATTSTSSAASVGRGAVSDMLTPLSTTTG